MQRLFIVPNRLPVTIDAETGPKPCSGGLVTAVSSYLRHTKTKGKQEFSEIFWAGVPGCNTSTWADAESSMPASEYKYLPVFVNKKPYDEYYNGFSNSVLWPLFHYFPSYAEYNMDHYQSYQQVNESFLEMLSRQLRPNDIVWIHDYHLLPLAGLLRKSFPQLTIGFFLHIPFPSFEIVRIMPRQWQEDILRGMLGADLIGFHTIDYASHFLESVQMTLGLDHDLHTLKYNDRLVKVDVFPISIDYKSFHDSYDQLPVEQIRESIKENNKEKKIIFSVDRLDYTKGLLNRLKAYEYFLLNNPEYLEKVVFIIVVVPSRDNIRKYAERKRMVDETISQINSNIGTFHWQPIIYQYNTLTFEQMTGLYSASDLALITPLRDGMNLVAKEFVASRKDKRGVLIISEMAGASRELTGGLSINPNDIREIAGKIKIALEMGVEEQEERMEIMQNRIATYDVQTWAEDFLSQLKGIKKKQTEYRVKFLDTYSKTELLEAYRSSRKRLLLLDYDGTLMPFSTHPSHAKPGPSLIQLLQTLGEQPENDVYIISGRNSDWLESFFGDLPVNLIAEHGAKTKKKKGIWASDIMSDDEWKTGILKIMDNYTKRCAHTFVEAKEFSLVWHYRNAVPEQAKLRSLELQTELNEYTHHRDLQVLAGNKIMEVRKYGIDKGSAVKKVALKDEHDFILAIGDDNTDEDMFKALMRNKDAFTIKVGPDASFAKYNLSTPQMVVSLLDAMAFIKKLVAA